MKSTLVGVVFLTGLAVFLFQFSGVNAKKYAGDLIPDQTRLPDGSYTGTYKIYEVISAAKVTFEIQDSTLVHFQLNTLLSTPGYGAADKINHVIHKKMKLHFDAVSGATISSNYVKAAIKNAILSQDGK